jgi:hypothetical protein
MTGLMGSNPGDPGPPGDADGTEGAFESAAPPAWIADSALLAQAYALAESAHRSQSRPTDGRPFLAHVTEVATLLHDAGFDEELVAVGLLHDAVERGTLSADDLRGEMGGDISRLVLILSEDPEIASFEDRKAALRDQVREAGGPAITVFAADKLSDIRGLRRGIQTFGGGVEQRIGTSASSMADHYRESVEVIESGPEGSAFLPALRAQLERLDEAALAVDGGPRRT